MPLPHQAMVLLAPAGLWDNTTSLGGLSAALPTPYIPAGVDGDLIKGVSMILGDQENNIPAGVDGGLIKGVSMILGDQENNIPAEVDGGLIKPG